MDQVIASQTAPIPQFRGTSRAQMDFVAMEARQREINPKQADQDFSFADFIDIINPLQHIPIVSTIYRQVTGDEISPAMKVAGGAIFGGPLGIISNLVSAVYEQASGEEIQSTVAGWFDGDKTSAKPAGEEIKLADIQWNQPATNFGLAAATPLPDQKPTAVIAANPVAAQVKAVAVKPDAAQLAAVAEAKPSPLFEGLQKGVMPATYSKPPQIPTYFNPNAAQFQGVQSAAAKTPAAAEAANDSMQQPQSDFAKKMMDALDRYESAKVAR